MTSAREVAFQVLREVHGAEAYANLLLPSRIRRAGLEGSDAGFATELSYGTLRGLGYYDHVIAAAAQRPAADIDAAALDMLRLGAHQLLSLGTPPHAAVNETVQLARRHLSRGAAGFVNAVLRAIGRRSPEQWREQVLHGIEGDARLAALHSHPEWIVRAFRQALAADSASTTHTGDSNSTADTPRMAGTASTPSAEPTDASSSGGESAASTARTQLIEADLERLLAADNAAPQVSLSQLPGLDDAAADGQGLDALPHSPVGLRWRGGDPGAWAPVRAGRIRVQDEGSQLAALTLSRARPVVAGERWLDLAAGPGGKAALLAAEAHRGGAVLVANEVNPARAELVRQSLQALPGEPAVLVGDGRRFGRADAIGVAAPGSFDRILLDAPCTGIGALRRRPEARWRKRPADVTELTALQEQLLDAAIAACAPGGLIAYVTCSPHLAETRGVLTQALKRHPQLRSLDTGAALSSLVREPLIGVRPGQNIVQLWPHRHNTDAMFIALLTVGA